MQMKIDEERLLQKCIVFNLQTKKCVTGEIPHEHACFNGRHYRICTVLMRESDGTLSTIKAESPAVTTLFLEGAANNKVDGIRWKNIKKWMDTKKDKDGRRIIIATLQVIKKVDEPKFNEFRPFRSINHPNVQRLNPNDENASCVPDASATVMNELR